MFQESIVEKVPVEVENGPDALKSYWWWNVCQLFFDEGSVLWARRHWKVCNTGKEDMGFNISFHFSTSFVDEIAEFTLKTLDLIFNSMWCRGT